MFCRGNTAGRSLGGGVTNNILFLAQCKYSYIKDFPGTSLNRTFKKQLHYWHANQGYVEVIFIAYEDKT